jgi:hypothetical protein
MGKLTSHDSIGALALVRQLSSADLASAVVYVRQLSQSAGLHHQTDEQDMGCAAQIIAIGPFSKDIVGALGYPGQFYKDVSEGAQVITVVFEAFGNIQSRKLAQCFQANLWDLGEHVLDASIADLKILEDEYDGAKDFIVLREAGFQFFFLPRG